MEKKDYVMRYYVRQTDDFQIWFMLVHFPLYWVLMMQFHCKICYTQRAAKQQKKNLESVKEYEKKSKNKKNNSQFSFSTYWKALIILTLEIV